MTDFGTCLDDRFRHMFNAVDML